MEGVWFNLARNDGVGLVLCLATREAIAERAARDGRAESALQTFTRLRDEIARIAASRFDDGQIEPILIGKPDLLGG